jgi:uncharacterized membrane protein
MHHLSEFEYGCGLVVLFLALVFIVILIAAGFKVASDAKVEEAEQSVERRAERLAKRLVRERLDGCRLQVIQRIDVIEDDLKGGRV